MPGPVSSGQGLTYVLLRRRTSFCGCYFLTARGARSMARSGFNFVDVIRRPDVPCGGRNLAEWPRNEYYPVRGNQDGAIHAPHGIWRVRYVARHSTCAILRTPDLARHVTYPILRTPDRARHVTYAILRTPDRAGALEKHGFVNLGSQIRRMEDFIDFTANRTRHCPTRDHDGRLDRMTGWTGSGSDEFVPILVDSVILSKTCLHCKSISNSSWTG